MTDEEIREQTKMDRDAFCRGLRAALAFEPNLNILRGILGRKFLKKMSDVEILDQAVRQIVTDEFWEKHDSYTQSVKKASMYYSIQNTGEAADIYEMRYGGLAMPAVCDERMQCIGAAGINMGASEYFDYSTGYLTYITRSGKLVVTKGYVNSIDFRDSKPESEMSALRVLYQELASLEDPDVRVSVSEIACLFPDKFKAFRDPEDRWTQAFNQYATELR